MPLAATRSEDGEIPFSQELYRKATHMGALIIPGGYYLLGLSRSEMVWVMIPATLFMIMIDISRLRQWRFWTGFASRIGGGMVRGHEAAGDFTGATYILISVCCTVAMYDKMIAIAALSFIIVGDTFAALIGRRFGRHHFGRKTIEGSLGCLLGTLLVAFVVTSIPSWVGVIGAVTATIVEALSFDIDDNISVPIVSGLVMTILTVLFPAL